MQEHSIINITTLKASSLLLSLNFFILLLEKFPTAVRNVRSCFSVNDTLALELPAYFLHSYYPTDKLVS